jgi:hypothetical protein
MNLAIDSWMLGVEATSVAASRLQRLAAGDAKAAAEAQLMVSEKIEALARLQWLALTGGLGSSPEVAAKRSIKHYRKAVAKNRRRFARTKR